MTTLRNWLGSRAAVRAAAALGCLIALGLAGCAPPAEKTADPVRGIVLITVDGLTPERLSLWGGPIRSERLETLAAQGRAWRDVWTPAPMSRPAAASLLTGQAPDRHGVVDDVLSSLPEGVPTLATRLGQAGFRTAAFPDSSFVGVESGLLRDFEVWDAPPRPNLGEARWLPAPKASAVQREAFATWMASLGEDERFFGWIHICRPLLDQLADRDGGAPPQIMQDFVHVVDAVLEAASAPDVVVALVGTVGDVRGDAEQLAGIGYSLGEPALRVPLVLRIPGGPAALRGPEAPVWTPDLAETLADLGGVTLPGSEGIALDEPRGPDDPLFSFTWATLDQLGWPAQRAVRLGDARRTEGLETTHRTVGDPAAAVEPAIQERLATALAMRGRPERVLVPLDAVEGLLTGAGVKLDPHPVDGREFGPAKTRLIVARKLWASRQARLRNDARTVLGELQQATALDPDNLVGLLDQGQIILPLAPDRAAPLLRRAVALYPRNPEVLHWFAHALWADDWQEGARILEAVLPHMEHDRDVLYDLACAASLGDRVDESEDYLRRAIEAGYEEWSHMEVDADLRALRESGRFATLMREYRR